MTKDSETKKIQRKGKCFKLDGEGAYARKHQKERNNLKLSSGEGARDKNI